MGVDLAVQRVGWNERLEVLLQLWDIAGQERQGTMFRAYFRDAQGAILVFDCTSEENLHRAKEWKEDIDSQVTWNGNRIPVVLFANKWDLGAASAIDNKAQMDAFCRENGFIAW